MTPSSVWAEISSSLGKRFAFDDERMVAGGGESLGQILENASAVVFDFAGFTVHQFLARE